LSLRFIDLFAGVGGTRLAFEGAGFTCVFSSEWDVHSQATYRANFGECPAGDIKTVASDSIPEFDVLVAGFPCQPFSSFGLRQGFEHKTQGTLFHEVARILRDKQPQAFMLENVKGLLTHDSGKTWEVIQTTLSEVGYHFDFKVLNSSDFGVPQARERIFIVGFLSEAKRDQFSFPTGGFDKVDIGRILEVGVTGYSITKHLQDAYIFKPGIRGPQIVNRESKGPAKTLVASYHKIQRLTGTFVRDGETGLRLLTENECKSIMGFPSDYQFPVSRTQMYRQLGNSVVVPLVLQIAKQIRLVLSSSK
jgi:DNA (cytosine-5)-methyltransferase 1